MLRGEDLEGAAQGSRPQALTLRASCQGDGSPWIPIFLRLWGQDFGSCLADTFHRDDRPPTHFFVKKKFIPTGDAESPERVVLRTYSLRHRKYPARRRKLFSLRKKRTAGIRLLVWQKAGSLYRPDPHPFSALKKPLKKMGFQRDASLWQEREGRALAAFPL